MLGGFIAFLHCCLMSVPLVVGLYNVGRHCVKNNSDYEVTYVYDNNGNYQESARVYSLVDSW